MPTPCHNCQKFGGQLGSLKTTLLALVINLEKESQAIIDLKRNGPTDVEISHEVSKKLGNECLAIVRKLEDIVSKSSKTVQDEFKLGIDRDHYLNGFKKDEYTVNTALGNHAQKLCAKVGYDECLHNLMKVSQNKQKRITDYKFCQCFGFRGSEKHFVDFWRDWGPKTHGILVHGTPFKGYTWQECSEFVDAYYKNYYLAQIRGEIRADVKTKSVVNVKC